MRDAKDAGSEAEAEWERGCLSNGRLTRLAPATHKDAESGPGEAKEGLLAHALQQLLLRVLAVVRAQVQPPAAAAHGPAVG